MDRQEPQWIKDELDTIEHLSTLRGDAYETEAKRLGLVITDKGVYADPHHPARAFRSLEDCKALIEANARRHGHELNLDDVDSGPASAAS